MCKRLRHINTLETKSPCTGSVFSGHPLFNTCGRWRVDGDEGRCASRFSRLRRFTEFDYNSNNKNVFLVCVQHKLQHDFDCLSAHEELCMTKIWIRWTTIMWSSNGSNFVGLESMTMWSPCQVSFSSHRVKVFKKGRNTPLLYSFPFNKVIVLKTEL